MESIRRAIVSVFDKTGLVPLAQALCAAGVELLSTGGTARTLREAGLPVVELSDFTGFPEMLDGRVKTLHPKVHGGLLYLRGNAEHEAAVEQHGIQPIDLVVVNLYPFEQTVAKPGVTLAEAIENIDIGGPAMLRSAAKNHEHVTVSPIRRITRRWRTRSWPPARPRSNSAAVWRPRSTPEPRPTTPPSPRICRGCSCRARPPPRRADDPGPGSRCAWSRRRWRSLSDTARTRTSPPRSTGGSRVLPAAPRQGTLLQQHPRSHRRGALIAEFAGRPDARDPQAHEPVRRGPGRTLREAWDKAFATDRQAPFGGIIAVNQPLDGRAPRPSPGSSAR